MRSIEVKIARQVFKNSLRIFLPLLILAGCGYHFPGGEEAGLPHLRTFFVEGFVNKTGEAYAENIVRSAFISRFVQEGRFKLAPGRDTADVVCRGSVTSIQISPLSYKTSTLAAEERMTLRMEISFEERASGRVIWQDKAVTGAGDYLVASSALTEKNRKDALLKLAADSAERAYLLMMSHF
jgi:hypothetical protein